MSQKAHGSSTAAAATPVLPRRRCSKTSVDTPRGMQREAHGFGFEPHVTWLNLTYSARHPTVDAFRQTRLAEPSTRSPWYALGRTRQASCGDSPRFGPNPQHQKGIILSRRPGATEGLAERLNGFFRGVGKVAPLSPCRNHFNGRPFERTGPAWEDQVESVSSAMCAPPDHRPSDF